MLKGEITVQVTTVPGRVSGEDLLSLLRESMEMLTPEGSTLSDWTVTKVSMASPLFWRGRNPRATIPARRRARAVRAIGEGRTPRSWSKDDARLIAVTQKIFNRGVLAVDIRVPGEGKFRLNTELTTALAEIRTTDGFEPRPVEEVGEWSGELYRVSVEANKCTFGLRDRVQNRVIDCTFNRENLLDSVKRILPCRVQVTGLIRYGADGFPTSIVATAVDALPDLRIAYNEWQGIDVTGGEDAATFVQRGRYG